MWVAKDRLVCGNPPCPICYNWHEPRPSTVAIDEPVITLGMVKFAQDLLGRAPANELEEKAVQEMADSIHKAGIKSLASDEPEEPPPVADIGMSSARRLEYKLNQLRRKAVAETPKQANLDEIFARKAEAMKVKKEKKAELAERMAEVRAFAKALQPDPMSGSGSQLQNLPRDRTYTSFANSMRDRTYTSVANSMRARDPTEDRILQELPPDFVRMASQRGWEPRQTVSEWRQRTNNDYESYSWPDPKIPRIG